MFLLLPIPLLSQQAIVRGRVIDPQGNVLPNASVQLVSHDQVVGQTSSGPDGLFELKVVSAGQFDLKVEATGFRFGPPFNYRSSRRESGPRDCRISTRIPD
jgi:Carboxypeptidase regulatory-like domain